MKLVVDANILFSFFKKTSFTTLDKFKGFWEEAERISPDPDDVEYIAVALSFGCTIWSNDKDLKEKQSKVKVFSTADLISFLS